MTTEYVTAGSKGAGHSAEALQARSTLPVCLIDSAALVELSRAQMGYMKERETLLNPYRDGQRYFRQLDPFGFLDYLAQSRCVVIPRPSLERALKPKTGIRHALNSHGDALFAVNLHEGGREALHNPSTNGLIDYLQKYHDKTPITRYESVAALLKDGGPRTGIAIIDSDYHEQDLHHDHFQVAKTHEADIFSRLVNDIKQTVGTQAAWPVIHCNSVIRANFKDDPVIACKLQDAARGLAKGRWPQKTPEQREDTNRRKELRSALYNGALAYREMGVEDHERGTHPNQSSRTDREAFRQWFKDSAPQKDNALPVNKAAAATVGAKSNGSKGPASRQDKNGTKPHKSHRKPRAQPCATVSDVQREGRGANGKGNGRRKNGRPPPQKKAHEITRNQEFIAYIFVPDHGPPHVHVKTRVGPQAIVKAILDGTAFKQSARFLLVEDAIDGRYATPYPYNKISDLSDDTAFHAYPDSTIPRDSDTMSAAQKERVRKFLNANVDQCIDKWREVAKGRADSKKHRLLDSATADRFLSTREQLEHTARHNRLRGR